MNTDPELSSVAEILIAMKKLPDAELLDLLAAVEKEGIQTPNLMLRRMSRSRPTPSPFC